jgi:hypothetical protein
MCKPNLSCSSYRTFSLSARQSVRTVGLRPRVGAWLARCMLLTWMWLVGKYCPLRMRYITMYSGGQQRGSVHTWSSKPSAILRTDQSSERFVLRLILSFTVGLRSTRSCASRSSRHSRGPVTFRSTPLFSDCANTTFREHANRSSDILVSSTFATTRSTGGRLDWLSSRDHGRGTATSRHCGWT